MQHLRKPFVVVLNKVDLAPAALVVAWKHYLTSRYPDVHVVLFTSFPEDSHAQPSANASKKGFKLLTIMEEDLVQFNVYRLPCIIHVHVHVGLRQKRSKRAQVAVGPRQLLEVIDSIVGNKGSNVPTMQTQ